MPGLFENNGILYNSLGYLKKNAIRIDMSCAGIVKYFITIPIFDSLIKPINID